MRKIQTCFIVPILILGLIANLQAVGVILYGSSESNLTNLNFNKIGFFSLSDPIKNFEEEYGSTNKPEYEALQIYQSENPKYEYMAVSPYYKIFFHKSTTKIIIKDTWIEFNFPEQKLGQKNHIQFAINKNSLFIPEIFNSVDLSCNLESSLIMEILTLKERKDVDRIIQEISWGGMEPEFTEDGSILFYNEKEILKILPPFMKDASGSMCTSLHYELVETEIGFELHKVIDEEGMKWLQNAEYPVKIDPSIETFEDAWESSGLQPYGQYFQNLKEYINPVNGFLTIEQTDLSIPGRGLDVTISRIYQTPAIFYGSDPYDYELPFVNVGKGWSLDFPHIGTKYVHLWNGTKFKITWNENQFINVRGNDFILVKNGDNTYALTTASGITYEFNTEGNLVLINDLNGNTINFSYTDGVLTSIIDTIGRTINLIYAGGYLWKINYCNEEIEYYYDDNGSLIGMEDFLARRTDYAYTSGFNQWLLSKIEYPTEGFTTYSYNRFADTDYYKYHVTDQRVFETNQVRHLHFDYTGSFEDITSSSITIQNELDAIKGSYHFIINDDLIIETDIRNSDETTIRKYTSTFNSKYEITEVNIYNDGQNLSFTQYFAYDDWGNVIYFKNAEGHEQFFSYANTSTSGFFIDNTGNITKEFTNGFSNSSVPSSVHTALLGRAEKQDSTFVREMYVTYDSVAHPTSIDNLYGNATSYLTYPGTFNEKTGTTSFPIDLSGHTVTGNAVLQISGLPSDDNYLESHSFNCSSCPYTCDRCRAVSGSWQNAYFKLNYECCYDDIYGREHCLSGYTASIGPFTHKPGSFGYDGYFTLPSMGQYFTTFTVKTRWKAYPALVSYNIDGSAWKKVSSNLRDTTAQIAIPITDGSHTLNFSESSVQNTKFSWTLLVPADNTPDEYTTSVANDTYGNVISLIDAESNTVSFSYSGLYSHAYMTEISTTVSLETITTKATYDYNRGWITSIQKPKGAQAGSGYDYLFTYDVLGRILKKEFPLLPGQSQRSYIEAVYDCDTGTTTIIDQFGHYIEKHYDRLGRHVSTKWFTGGFGSGTLYATKTYSYRYDNLVHTEIDPGGDQIVYSYDFFGRETQIQYPDMTTAFYSYDDTNNKVTMTNRRGFERIYWYDWLSRLEKVEEEFILGMYASTQFMYNNIGQLVSMTDAENHTTSYFYESFFGLTRTTYPDLTYEEYGYDTIGNITSVRDCNGQVTNYIYDSMYRLTQIHYPDQSSVSYTYDIHNNRISMQDNSPYTGDHTDYSYDQWDRLTSETRYILEDSFSLSFEYDIANRLTALVYPDDTRIVYLYDDLGRMIEVKRFVDGQNDEILMDEIRYDEENLLSQFNYGNNLQSSFSYDSNDRFAAIQVKNGSTSFLDLEYIRDNKGNITHLINGWRDTASTWHSDTESYSYDGLDRLTSASCTSWSHLYSYDTVGNRTARDSLTYSLNTVNEIISVSDGTNFAYDDNGNRIQKTKGYDTWIYMYDHENRLIEVKKNQSTIGEYVYDGDGIRLQKTENGTTTTYIHFNTSVFYERNSTGEAIYMYGPHGLLAKRTTINEESNTFYYHSDHVGSIRLVTDADRNIIVSATYKPFGELHIKEGDEHYFFTGKERDVTDLYYYGGRYYDPDVGTFLTRDPYTSLPNDIRSLGNNLQNQAALCKYPQRFNQYVYALNNPLRYNDPTGFWFECVDPECEKLLNPPPSPPPPDLPSHIKCADPECEALMNGSGGSGSGSGTNSGDNGGNGNGGESESKGSLCDSCDCMNDSNIQDLIEYKSFAKNQFGSVGNSINKAVLCTLIGIIFGAPTGIYALALIPIITIVCSVILDKLQSMSYEKSMKNLKQKFIEAGCECAFYCSDD